MCVRKLLNYTCVSTLSVLYLCVVNGNAENTTPSDNQTKLTVEWGKNPGAGLLGEKVTFTVSATGGSGSANYRYTWSIVEGNEEKDLDVADTSCSYTRTIESDESNAKKVTIKCAVRDTKGEEDPKLLSADLWQVKIWAEKQYGLPGDYIDELEDYLWVYATYYEENRMPLVYLLQIRPLDAELPKGFVTWEGGPTAVGGIPENAEYTLTEVNESGVNISAKVDDTYIFKSKLYIFPGAPYDFLIDVTGCEAIHDPNKDIQGNFGGISLCNYRNKNAEYNYFYRNGQFCYFIESIDNDYVYNMQTLGRTDIPENHETRYPYPVFPPGMTENDGGDSKTYIQRREQARSDFYVSNPQDAANYYEYCSIEAIEQHEIGHFVDWMGFMPKCINDRWGQPHSLAGIDVTLNNIDNPDKIDLLTEDDEDTIFNEFFVWHYMLNLSIYPTPTSREGPANEYAYQYRNWLRNSIKVH